MRAVSKSKRTDPSRDGSGTLVMRRLSEGSGAAVVVVNGFLTEHRERPEADWLGTLETHYPKCPWYVAEWRSRGIRDLARELAAALRAPLPVLAVAGALAGSWRLARKEAESAGVLLANQIADDRQPRPYVVLAHSLGASVVYHALRSLAARQAPADREMPRVATVHLLGGALGKVSAADWEQAACGVSGAIHNYFSVNDRILQLLYPAGQLAVGSVAIGRRPVVCASVKIVNHDVSRHVASHRSFKTEAARFLCLP